MATPTLMYSSLHQSIHSWYQQHGRHELPWRHHTDPYAIYISEIMLQQTQVETVLARFYEPFLTRFPTLAAVRDAPLEEVLHYWQGLGYYHRARNIHRTAIFTDGQLPTDYEGLVALPGIGRNTAHAILAFAHHLPYAVMEANLRRLLYRFHALEAASDTEIWKHAEALLDRTDPFDYNQAMMDLGAMVCTPRAPLCGHCPLASGCKGKTNPEAYSQLKTKAKVPTRKQWLVFYQNEAGQVALVQRQGNFLHGLYGVPEYDTAPALPNHATRLGTITHGYSHFKLEAEVYHLMEEAPFLDQFAWYTPAKGELPISTRDRKALSLLAKNGAAKGT